MKNLWFVLIFLTSFNGAKVEERRRENKDLRPTTPSSPKNDAKPSEAASESNSAELSEFALSPVLISGQS